MLQVCGIYSCVVILKLFLEKDTHDIFFHKVRVGGLKSRIKLQYVDKRVNCVVYYDCEIEQFEIRPHMSLCADQ